MKKFIVYKWAVRYYNGRPMIALSRHKKCPRFDKDDNYSPFADSNYYDVYPEDLGRIKLPFKKPVKIKITTEIVRSSL